MTAQRRSSRTSKALYGAVAAGTIGFLTLANGGFQAKAANLLVNPGFESPSNPTGSEDTNVTG